MHTFDKENLKIDKKCGDGYEKYKKKINLPIWNKIPY